jgi:hypothetical protein
VVDAKPENSVVQVGRKLIEKFDRGEVVQPASLAAWLRKAVEELERRNK